MNTRIRWNDEESNIKSHLASNTIHAESQDLNSRTPQPSHLLSILSLSSRCGSLSQMSIYRLLHIAATARVQVHGPEPMVRRYWRVVATGLNEKDYDLRCAIKIIILLLFLQFAFLRSYCCISQSLALRRDVGTHWLRCATKASFPRRPKQAV